MKTSSKPSLSKSAEIIVLILEGSSKSLFPMSLNSLFSRTQAL
jgi:hypothetical protein